MDCTSGSVKTQFPFIFKHQPEKIDADESELPSFNECKDFTVQVLEHVVAEGHQPYVIMEHATAFGMKNPTKEMSEEQAKFYATVLLQAAYAFVLAGANVFFMVSDSKPGVYMKVPHVRSRLLKIECIPDGDFGNAHQAKSFIENLLVLFGDCSTELAMAVMESFNPCGSRVLELFVEYFTEDLTLTESANLAFEMSLLALNEWIGKDRVKEQPKFNLRTVQNE
eukprot:TRINITY_DN3208_c0_g1_i5.p1 TRINITY_DN3208_c0_g1~~TRINITY_DN3208_c0_g1_i5.p1  ORF type:complete len:224 (-),score=52.27 TRINITY_DN3208_c0_g1_i5:443-1114(-)